jgi:aryl-alcohol dehydrogenase-like predicted oxidoreductase
MEYRQLGHSGLKVSAVGLGCNNFGRRCSEDETKVVVHKALDLGVTMFDTADFYSAGLSEDFLGKALGPKRKDIVLATKFGLPMRQGEYEGGASRRYIMLAVEASLRRLGTDYIDLYQLHFPDLKTPIEETLSALDTLVRAGKIRYIAASNFSGWHLMKSLAIADRYGWPRYAAHQAYYSLVGREFEWELMPLAVDQGVGTIVWSPLGWGRLTGKIRRGQPMPETSRLPATKDDGPPVPDDLLYDVVDALDAVAKEAGKTVPQVALAWLLTRPTVSSVIVGARDPKQLEQNLGAVGWALTGTQLETLDRVSRRTPIYPYWHQLGFAERNPFPV